MTDVFLGIDQGSSSTKGVLVTSDGDVLYHYRVSAPPISEVDKHVEQDALKILDSVTEVFAACVSEAKRQGKTIASWGLATQRSGVVAWNKLSGDVMCPMITWADTRTQHMIDGFGREADKITEQTGLPTIANFAAPKIHLLQRSFQDATTLVATLDTFLLHRLTNGLRYTTEDTMAARTMLYNLNDQTWSEDLCRRFKVEKRRLPEITPSLFSHGVYKGIPLTAMLGDQQAALFSFGGTKNQAVLNLGTIGSAVVMTGDDLVLQPGLKTTPCYSSEGQASKAKDVQYVSEITYPSLGSSMRGILHKGWCQSSAEIDAMCAASLAKTSDPKVCAYWANETEASDAHPFGAPDTMKEKPDADDSDRVRAVTENIGNHIVLMLEELQAKGLLEEAKKTAIEVSGGVSAGEYLLQYIADVSGYTLRCRQENEATAIGAALASMFYTLDLTYVPTIHTEQAPRVFSPQDSTRRKGFLVWQRLRRDVLAGQVL